MSVQMATILFYLSDVEEGGETVFLLEGEDGMERKPSIDYKSCDVGYKVPPSTSFSKGPFLSALALEAKTACRASLNCQSCAVGLAANVATRCS